MKQINGNEVPTHLVDYLDALEKVARFCEMRASHRDKTIEELAHKFAQNVIDYIAAKGKIQKDNG